MCMLSSSESTGVTLVTPNAENMLQSDDTRVAIHRLTQTGAVRVRAAALGAPLPGSDAERTAD